MKKTIITMLLFGLATVASGETLERAEKLTESEQAAINKVSVKVWQAEQELIGVKISIAEKHNMRDQTYMEWSSRVTFDGEYILLYRQSFSFPSTLATDTGWR